MHAPEEFEVNIILNMFTITVRPIQMWNRKMTFKI